MNKRRYINDEDDLYRRIHPLQYNKVDDRVNSSAFTDYGTSVNWARYITPKKQLKIIQIIT